MTRDKESLRIVFFGTPDFAVESLDRLVKGGFNIVGVVTMPDKVGGRGNKVVRSAVKLYAVENGLNLLQPAKLKDPEFVEQLRALKADLQIVIAFRMLPEVVWNMPPLGTFNLHASLLPKYRGAAPINWAVMNGDKETGVTTFFLKHEIDTGDIIQQRKIDIAETDNVGIVHDKLMTMGADMVLETVEAILRDEVKPISQEELCNKGADATPAPKIFTDTCHIDWSKSAREVYNHIRGLSPYPAAWTEIEDQNGKLHHAKIYATALPADAPIGDVTENRVGGENGKDVKAGAISTDGKRLGVACGDGKWIEITSLQIAGKRRMTTDEFLRGFRLKKQP